MKKIIVIAFVLMLFLTEKWTVAAPELFGRSTAYMIGNSGLVFSDYGMFLIFGDPENCTLYELAGAEIGDGDGGIVNSISCSYRFSDEGNRFSGTINFRGHPRPFCGTQTSEFMQPCKDW